MTTHFKGPIDSEDGFKTDGAALDGTVDMTPPEVASQSVANGTIGVDGLKTTDDIMVSMLETPPAEAIPVAGYCDTNGVLTVEFANITGGTTGMSSKSIGWLKLNL